MNELDRDLESVLSRALAFDSVGDRARYLVEACGGDERLRAEVEDLLRAREDDEASLETPAFSAMTTAEHHGSPEAVGSMIGHYRLLEKIGAGGMGTVYLAEQTAPIRRKVAIKMINLGMDSGRVIARFEAERQALALMDHPNIAGVHDAGTTEAGRPFFVMEWIRGLPITEYCDTARLPIAKRLGLFLQVCRAVQHAHQKGIIHRDLKPSNILVTVHDGEPVTKVIDFGIAKAMGGALTDATIVTGLGQPVGTLLYMSPEQAAPSGLDIDTRSDLYSLGVILYELLTGTTPFDKETIHRAEFAEAQRIIRDVEPPKPSTRLSALGEKLTSVSAKRGLDPPRLRSLLRGELDWIVMRALAKDRARRYETASELARDIERYLADEPVEARPPSATYRMAKFARRHRVGLAATAVIGVSLATTAVVSVVMAIRARRSEADSAAVLRFFRDKVLAAARAVDQEGGLGRDVSLRAALDAAERTVAADFQGRPAVEAAVRDTLGLNYWYLGDPAAAVKQLERASALREAHLGKNHPETLETNNNLASAFDDSGEPDRAAALAKQVLDARRATLGPTHPDTLTSLNNLGVDLHHSGRVVEAIPLFEEALELRRSRLGPDDPLTLATMGNLAQAYGGAGRFDDAERLLKQAYDLKCARLGPDHLETLITLNNLAAVYWMSGRAAEAIPLFARVLGVEKAKLGGDHPRTLRTQSNLASANWLVGRQSVAIRLYEEALDHLESRLGPNHPDTLTMGYNLAVCYRTTGQAAKAVPLFERALAVYRVKPGVESEDALTTMDNLAAAYLDLKDHARAEPLLRECLGIRMRTGSETWRRFRTMSQLGAALMGQKRFADAEPMLTDGYRGLRDRETQIPEGLRKVVAEAASRIVQLYEDWGRPEKAAEWREEIKATAAGTPSGP